MYDDNGRLAYQAGVFIWQIHTANMTDGERDDYAQRLKLAAVAAGADEPAMHALAWLIELAAQT